MYLKRLKIEVDVPRLSARELQVYKLLKDGKTNREISSILEIAPGTVKSHVMGIYNKEIHK